MSSCISVNANILIRIDVNCLQFVLHIQLGYKNVFYPQHHFKLDCRGVLFSSECQEPVWMSLWIVFMCVSGRSGVTRPHARGRSTTSRSQQPPEPVQTHPESGGRRRRPHAHPETSQQHAQRRTRTENCRPLSPQVRLFAHCYLSEGGSAPQIYICLSACGSLKTLTFSLITFKVIKSPIYSQRSSFSSLLLVKSLTHMGINRRNEQVKGGASEPRPLIMSSPPTNGSSEVFTSRSKLFWTPNELHFSSKLCHTRLLIEVRLMWLLNFKWLWFK